MNNTDKTNDKEVQIGSATFSRAGIGMPISNIGGYTKNSHKFLPYTNDSLRDAKYNLYPQQIARLAYDSPTNGAALQRKAFMIKGEGFDFTGVTRPLMSMFNNINGNGEHINDILAKVSADLSMFGGFALKITWGNDGYIRYVEHIPFTFVRCGMPNENDVIDYYVVSNDWDSSLPTARAKTYSLPKFDPSYFDTMEQDGNGTYVPNDYQIEQAEQIIYYKAYQPIATNGQLYYPVPDYANALDAIETEVSIGVSNKSLIDNGIGGKVIATFPYKTTEKEKAQIDSKFKDNFTGSYNNGAVMTMFAANADELPKFEKFEPITADTYVELEKSVKQSIITAHGVPAILLEYNYGGGFNNRAEEMQQAYDMFQQTRIKDYQLKIISVFNKVVYYMGWDNTMSIIPFKVTTEQVVAKPNTVTTDSGTNIQE